MSVPLSSAKPAIGQPRRDVLTQAVRIIADPPRLIVVLRPIAFGGRHEAERQADSWALLYRQMTTDDRPQLEFVFDDTLGLDPADRG